VIKLNKKELIENIFSDECEEFIMSMQGLKTFIIFYSIKKIIEKCFKLIFQPFAFSVNL
jgi:hypothetical protein